jgi:hypothetical protein
MLVVMKQSPYPLIGCATDRFRTFDCPLTQLATTRDPGYSAGMRQTLPFGSFELAGTWQDASTLHFVGALESEAMPLLVGAQPQAQRITVTLTSGRLEAGATLEAVLETQQHELAQSFPGFRIISRQRWPHPTYGEVPQIDFCFDAGPTLLVRQRQSYFRWPDVPRFSCLAFSAESSAYDAALGAFGGIFASFVLPADVDR